MRACVTAGSGCDLGEALAGAERVRAVAVHLDGERPFEHVDEQGKRMHVATHLAAWRHLGQHGGELIVALREANRLAGDRGCRF